MALTRGELKLVSHARKRYPAVLGPRRKKGLNDTYYACVLSKSGRIYEAIPFDPLPLGSSHICCERVAIANMHLAETEKARVESVLVIGPVGRGGVLTPCGLCLYVIDEMSEGKATVLCAGEYFERTRNDFGFLFEKIKKYKIRELYPHPWKDGTWD